MKLRFALLAVAALVLSTGGLATDRDTEPQIVSIVQLLSTPSDYDGKPIVVFGFLTIGQENNNLYLGKTDYDNELLANSLWVEPSRDMLKNSSGLDKKYVRIVGTFHRGHVGRERISVGGVSEIKECKFWSDPDHPFSERLKNLEGR